MRADMRAVLSVALRYGVRAEQWSPERSDEMLSEAPPTGGGCDPMSRLVLYDPAWRACYVLHEVVHVILWLPTRNPRDGIGRVCEGKLLMAFETALDVSAKATKELIDYQNHTTVLSRDGGRLVEYGSIRSDERFHERPRRIAREIGILDDDLRPTYQWPDWKRLQPKDRRWLLRGGTAGD